MKKILALMVLIALLSFSAHSADAIDLSSFQYKKELHEIVSCAYDGEKYDDSFYEKSKRLSTTDGEIRDKIANELLSEVRNANPDKFCHGVYTILFAILKGDDFAAKSMLDTLLPYVNAAMMLETDNPMRMQEQLDMYLYFIRFHPNCQSRFFFTQVYQANLSRMTQSSQKMIENYKLLINELHLPLFMMPPQGFTLPKTEEQSKAMNPECQKYFEYLKKDQIGQIYALRKNKFEQIVSYIKEELNEGEPQQ